jgi:hypothetical protein
MRRIHWKWILLAGFLAEVSVFAIFFLLLLAATAAGNPGIARPMGALDYVDALVSSFASIFLFTLWAGKRIDSGFVLHGALIGVFGILLFAVIWIAATGSLAQPPLYVVAHGLKILGGVAGGRLAGKRRRQALPDKAFEASSQPVL